ncbi:MAG: LacI family DNA-binding transcriptional regulator [Planctomycetota bacterium]
MTSIREIAKSLELSASTVSRALNNSEAISASTRERVFQAAREVGYKGAVGKRPVSTIGLISQIDDPNAFGGFVSVVVAGAMRAAQEENCDVAFVNGLDEKHQSERYAQFLRRKGVGGALLLGRSAPRIAEELAADRFPHLIVANRSDEPSVSFIKCDSRESSRAAVEHLISLGHRRIGVGLHAVPTPDHIDRLEGYRDALRAHSIPDDEMLVVRAMAHDQAAGVGMLEDLLRLEDPPSAIFFTNPLTTVGALLRCAQLSIRVPHELSIVGFDDSSVRYSTFPVFTAVCQDAERLTSDGMRWLLRAIHEGLDAPLRETRETTLSLGESTIRVPSERVSFTKGGQVVRIRP